jgi:hypothetical protein
VFFQKTGFFSNCKNTLLKKQKPLHFKAMDFQMKIIISYTNLSLAALLTLDIENC